MSYRLQQQGRKRKRKRLKDIQPFEVAIVPRGANNARFVVLKEGNSMKLDPKKLAEAHAALGRIVIVCKSGTPAAETVEKLETDLQNVAATLMDAMGTNSSGKVDMVGVKTRIDEISSLADGLADSTHDLNMQDQIDALLAKIKELDVTLESFAAPAAPTTTEASGTTTEGKPAEAQAQTGDVGETSTAAETSATADAATADAATAEEQTSNNQEAASSTATEEQQGNTQAAATEGATEVVAKSNEVVTKEDLNNLSQTIVNGFKEVLGSLVTTLKSADTGRPQLIYPAGLGAEAAQPPRTSDPSAHDESHWGNQFDLNAD